MATKSTIKPRFTATMLATLAHDGIMAFAAMQVAIWLRYSFTETPVDFFYLANVSVLFAAVAMGVFLILGLHRGLWRYTSFDDVVLILKSVTLATFIFLPLLFLATRLEGFPRTVPLMQWPLLTAGLLLSRIAVRLLTSGDLAPLLNTEDRSRVPIILVGASQKLEPFIREAQRLEPTGFPYRIVGLIDPDPENTGHDIRSKRIMGDLHSLSDVVRQLTDSGHTPQKIVLTDPDMKGDVVASLLEQAEALGLALARAPEVTDIQTSDRSKPINIRPVDLRDLLGRPQKVLDRSAMRRLVTGKRVLITGAGGTIGSELTRQVAALGPSKITVLDHSEFNLYQIDLELKEAFPNLPRQDVLADVRDSALITKVFEQERPQIVCHAAALKHVPIVEENPAEGILTNVIGTRNVVDASLKHSVEVMVMISTDKAVNPSSMMGASKRVAELYCQAQEVQQSKTRFVTVRFGNVLGSTGSVVPLFQRQLAKGGPLTVTDKKMSRYFMTTGEAVELVLQAATLDMPSDEGAPSAKSLHDGRIYVLDMGKPVLIKDLAERIVRLAGLRPYEDIDIVFTGIRPGEKLHETLFHELEQSVPTTSDGILLAAPRMIDLRQLEPALDRLSVAARERNKDALERIVRGLVPEFSGSTAPPASLSQEKEQGQQEPSPTLH